MTTTSPEAIVVSAIGTLAGGLVYPDLAPAGTAPNPFITYTRIGGPLTTYVDGTLPTLRKARMRIQVWTTQRLATEELMETVLQALCNPTVGGVPLGEAVSEYEEETLLYGAALDVSITFS